MKSSPSLFPAGAALLLLLGCAATAAAAPGDLDASFGTQGVALAAIGDEGAVAMVLQADGKALTATLADAGTDRATLRLTRFTLAGAVDTAFGTAGTASVQLPVETQSTVAAMLRQSTDNRLLVGGRSVSALAVTRLTTAGAIDAGFGTGGTAKTTIAGDDEILALAQQPSDGKILAVGRADDGRDSDFAVVRFTTAGQLDTTFSGDGIQTIEFGGDDVARAVAVHTDGTIVVAGSTGGSTSDLAVARLTSTGALDPTFGSGGKVTTSVTAGDDAAHAVLVQGDGRIVVAGEADDDFVAVRYTSGGQPDAGFGASGIRRTDVSAGGSDVARALVRQGDDRLVAAGTANPGRAGVFALVRYTTGGQLDSTFSGDGVVTTTPSAIFDGIATALALQDDGKLVAAGVTEDGNTTYQMLSRYAGSAASTCGNGTVEGTEQCDDSNTASGDGCSSTCTLESACGDADRNGSITSTDALRALRAAVGQPVTCPGFVCDVDANAALTSSDALKILKKAVGQSITLTCPLP